MSKADHDNLYHGKRSIKSLLILSFIILVILFVAVSVPNLYRAYKTLHTANETEGMIEIADNLFQAVRHFGFERGRVNVVLNYKGPNENMAANRTFIVSQRTAGEKAFNDAISKIRSGKFPIDESYLNQVTEQHDRIEELRKTAGTNMDLPYEQRATSVASEWFPEMTELIESIENYLFRIYIYTASTDPQNGIGFRLKLDALSLRNTAGPECSLIVSLNNSGAVITDEQLNDIHTLRTQTDLHWREIKRIEEYLDYPSLHLAINKVDKMYFTDLREMLEQVRLSADDPSIERVPQQVLIDRVVESLEAIAGIMDAAKEVSTEISLRNKRSAVSYLASMLAVNFSIIAVVILITILLIKKIINPTSELTRVMYGISEEKEIIKIPYTNRQDEIGKLARVVALFRKYSLERKVQTERLRREKERAEEATRAKSIFLANMSHEIRTPITGLLGLTEMSLDLNPSGKIKKNLELSLTTTESLLTLINDILDFEKISADKITISNSAFNLHESMKDSVELYRFMADNKDLELSLSIGSDVPEWIESDKIRIEQITRNLISNAVKFTDSGSVRINLAIEGRGRHKSSDQMSLIISVEDSGCGISEADQKNIFKVFTQLDPSYSKKYQGTGLGLSICKSLLNKMDGEINVQSEIGKGSVFTCSLPVKHTEKVAVKKTESISGEVIPRKILFAEDDAINRLYLKHFLESEGHQVIFAGTGRELILKLREEDFNLVISDVQMPEMDGVEAVKLIRAGEAGDRNTDIPVIAFTAYSTEADKQNFNAAGFTGYLSKPVHIARLREIIRSQSLKTRS